jgi:hypothetical protein
MNRSRDIECARLREALRDGRRDASHEAHLFGCAPCRLEARLAAAWKTIPRPEETESAQAERVDDQFIRGVLARVRDDRQRRSRNRVRLAAAAALLFFFLAGASEKLAASIAAGADDTYAQLLTPSLDTFLPD